MFLMLIKIEKTAFVLQCRICETREFTHKDSKQEDEREAESNQKRNAAPFPDKTHIEDASEREEENPNELQRGRKEKKGEVAIATERKKEQSVCFSSFSLSHSLSPSLSLS